MKVGFKATIVGGPHDGAEAVYEGECVAGQTDAEVFKRMHFLELEGHRYRVQSFDMQTKTAKLIW